MTALVTAGAGAKGAITVLALLAAQGTLLALIAVAAIRIARLGPAAAAAIWLVVLAKFALPWGPAMPWSLSDLLAALRHHEVGPVLAVGPVGTAPAAAASAWPAIGWLALAAAWLAGTSLVLVRGVRAYRATLGAARRAAPAPGSAAALLAELAGKTRVRLAVGDAATGPYVVGLLRPIIVVPPALLGDPALLRAALLHELAHVHRKDALARVIQIWASAVFFWWPVVRLASRRLDLTREAACDAAALESTELARPAYARLLLQMAALRAAAAPALAHPRSLDARVAAVLGPPARARIGLVGRALIAAFAVLALGGARSAQARGEHNICVFTPLLAEELRQAHPEADLDGDGTLSKDEACELQAEMRRKVETGEAQVSTLDEASAAELDRLINQPLCCNAPGTAPLIPASTTGGPPNSCPATE